jgi:hypothetical protein
MHPIDQISIAKDIDEAFDLAMNYRQKEVALEIMAKVGMDRSKELIKAYFDNPDNDFTTPEVVDAGFIYDHEYAAIRQISHKVKYFSVDRIRELLRNIKMKCIYINFIDDYPVEIIKGCWEGGITNEALNNYINKPNNRLLADFYLSLPICECKK